MEYDRSRFAQAESLWREWNAKINVISRKDIDFVFEHHILHSLAIAEYMARRGLTASSFLDVGTGGGFPGIPLAMVMPQAQFTLCDSIGKKIKVASALAEGLGLENVRCVNCRAESLDEEFDYVVSRAVTGLDNFYPWVAGKFRKGILYLKGGDVNEEISRLCGKCAVKPSSVKAWPISEWLEDDYYKEKFVIEIEK